VLCLPLLLRAQKNAMGMASAVTKERVIVIQATLALLAKTFVRIFAVALGSAPKAGACAWQAISELTARLKHAAAAMEIVLCLAHVSALLGGWETSAKWEWLALIQAAVGMGAARTAIASAQLVTLVSLAPTFLLNVVLALQAASATVRQAPVYAVALLARKRSPSQRKAVQARRAVRDPVALVVVECQVVRAFQAGLVFLIKAKEGVAAKVVLLVHHQEVQ